MSKLNYKTSKDYKRLKELLDKGNEVIVMFPVFVNGEKERRVYLAHTFEDFYFLGGFCWREGFEPEDFEVRCEKTRVEFIEPNGEE